MKRKAIRVIVTGIVQGVGFRPFVYRIATLAGVNGHVRNLGGSEVEILLEAPFENIAKFLRLFVERLPPPARIEEVEVIEEKVKGVRGFRILSSARRSEKRSMIPPDFAVCKECLREILDPRNRRYRYPFNSCAYCGPRFSMMYTVPYDRENTAMRDFPLCEECRREYEDPWNERRFHAQGISCPQCGPRLALYTSSGEPVETKDPIRETARLIDEGFIVAVKGIGGFHIAALASDDDVVLKLRRRKRRPTKPFAIMALNLEVARRLVIVDEEAARVLESPEAPILLLPRRDNAPVSPYVAPGLDTLGVMLAYTPLHYLLLSETRDKYLIMTSGNIHGKPMCITEECVFKRLSGIVDYVLVHNRRIVHRVDDSVARFTAGRLVLIRRSRGYAPAWIRLGFRLSREIVAFGAELQNAGGVGFEDKVVLTQYVGDTDDFDTLSDLERFLEWFVNVYRIDLARSVLVADMHPRYASRMLAEKWAERHGAQLILVQHHHAHVASVMAEKKLRPGEPRAGIAIDGVGYGLDGSVWGGEVIVTDMASFERVGHLEPQPLPGGDRAVEYPGRIAVAILAKAYGASEALRIAEELGVTRGLPHGPLEAEVVVKTYTRAPRASSMGRILDAFSALLGVCYHRGYEGEPAIRLEAYGRKGRLLDDLTVEVKGGVVNTTRLFREVVEAIYEGVDKRSLAYTVQWRLGEALAEIAARAAAEVGADEVYMAGGAAVNDIIVRGVEHVLKREGLRLVLPSRVPPGDGGIALGQVAVAAAKLVYDEH